MQVRDVMRTNFKTLTSSSSYEDAARLMLAEQVSGVFIVDEGKLVGVVSEKDLFRVLYPRYEEFARQPEEWLVQERRETQMESVRNQALTEIMTRKVISIDPDAGIMKAGGIMLAHGIHRLAVLDRGTIVGIVSREEIYSALLEHHLGATERDTRRDSISAR